MELIQIDPRALTPNPNPMRRTPANPAADTLMIASIQAVGIIQPPVVKRDKASSNTLQIEFGHRRANNAIAAGLELINVLVADDDEINDMAALIENVAREPLNPVDLWRSIEQLIDKDWTEEAIASALAQTVRQVRKLRLLAKLYPPILDQIALGDMPEDRYLRTIASASLEEQAEAWGSQSPEPGSRTSWYTIANTLTKTRYYARHASFGDDLAAAYGIEWQDDLFAPADVDNRFTTDAEAFLGAQNEWMTANLPKKGIVLESSQYGEPKLPPKAQQVYGKPLKSDKIAHYLDRDGSVKTLAIRLAPDPKKTKGNKGESSAELETEPAEPVSTPRPDVTQAGLDMIGDLRTDALHEALERSPIEDDTLMALLVLSLCGLNVSIRKANNSGYRHMDRYATVLLNDKGSLDFDRGELRIVARKVLADVLSCRRDATSSGPVAVIAGEAVGADTFLPNMATQEFLSCLSRPALERICADGNPVLPRNKVKDTRAALVEHFAGETFVYPGARFGIDEAIRDWIRTAPAIPQDDGDGFEADAGNVDLENAGDADVPWANDTDEESVTHTQDDASADADHAAYLEAAE